MESTVVAWEDGTGNLGGGVVVVATTSVCGSSCKGTVIVGCISGSGGVGDRRGCSGGDDGGGIDEGAKGTWYDSHPSSYCDSVISEVAPRPCV